MDVAKVMENSARGVVNNAASNKVSQVAKEVVCIFNVVVEFVNEPSSSAGGKKNRIDPAVEITARVCQWVVV